MKRTNGFTLIELMIVIAIIGILIGTTFKLMQVAVEAKARAVTIARMERLQNALSGYFSAYGMYPAVPAHVRPVLKAGDTVKDEENGTDITGLAALMKAAARAQPIGFEYPTPLWLTSERLKKIFPEGDVISMEDAWASMDNKEKWEECKTFKFGLLSFLLPRIEVVGNSYGNTGTRNNSPEAPIADVYIMEQWKGNNKASSISGRSNDAEQDRADRLVKQRDVENEICRRWMPCFENVLRSFADNILGVNVNCNDGSGHRLRKRFSGKSGTYVALAYITIVDGWGNEFYYYAAPPYQSYRVWSAGPDRNTFPPWVPSSAQEYSDCNAQELIKDDIVGGKMQM